MRVHYGPGYRLYYIRDGAKIDRCSALRRSKGHANPRYRARQATGRRFGDKPWLRHSPRWDVTDHLHTEEDARLYLEAAFEEDLGDGRLIRAALSDIARARDMSPACSRGRHDPRGAV